jgi:Flagellar basal body-associated protein FliL.
LQGKSLYAVLLSIIAVLTLALAVMVIFLFATYNRINANQETVVAEDLPAQTREVPPEEEARINLYATGDETTGSNIFNLKPSPAHGNSYLRASITVVFDAGEKKKLLESRTEVVNSCIGEFKEACIEYFRNQTYEDLSEGDAMNKAREALKEKFNEIVAQKYDERIILRVVFEDWIIQ